MSENDVKNGLNAGIDSTRFLASDLCAILETYLEPDQIREVYRAYLFGAEAHEGQTRMSGEPYIYHPLAVAKTMAEMRMDHNSIIAAILHDVIEDTPTAKEQLQNEFGNEVADLVDGVSKLTHLKFESKAEMQAENFRKMMMAMSTDLRVILVKLADRLHNMRTLGVMRPEKKRRISRETLEIYAPIAQRLGMTGMRRELELLGFEAMYPCRYRVLSEATRKAAGHRREPMHQIEASICNRMEEAGIEARIFGREKNLFSIYKKMRDKHLSFHDVYDVFAIRIVVESVDTCYRCLGIMHNLYKPVPGRFKDYIAIPKANGYQSLHTVLFGPRGMPIEVQIRTREMDRVAESGIAAHWLYKSGDAHSASAQARAREWLRGILEMQQSAGNSMEFLENVKVDLFPDEVYVFTPKGDIMEMPRGATPVDFAYAVHTDIGNSCVAVKINRRLAPLSTRLESGHTVEIITAPGTRPNPAWLDFVVTAKARSNIRHFLKHLQDEEALKLGRRLLDKLLAPHGLDLEKLDPQLVSELLEETGHEDMDDLIIEIGLGNRMPQLAVRKLAGLEEDSESGMVQNRPLDIRGSEGMVLTYGKCCHPIPGDPIIGVITAGRGMVIHREDCPNISDLRNKPDKAVSVQWADEIAGDYPTIIRMQVTNQRGVLASLATRIADSNSNIENVDIDEKDAQTTTVTFTVTVRDRAHLAQLMRDLRKIPEVVRIWRSRG
jgi:GTP pyrophosphokinase